jgi:drug/metabolite transporter (DMT)-like permease
MSQSPPPGPDAPGRPGALHALRALRARADALGPTLRGMLWTIAAGLLFSVLNASMRAMALELDSYQTQFLRYLFGLLVMLPLVLRSGLAHYRPNDPRGQFLRGATHTAGMFLWFAALPKIPLADTTAIGFTGPIFTMIGAWLFLGERMYKARWLAAAVGLLGVLVVIGPKLDGSGGYYNLVMLASAPVFSASFLLAKALTRRDRPEVIVFWQTVTVTLFTLPAALLAWRQPSAFQWMVFAACGVLGSLGHYCMTRAFRSADISATQPVKFLDLIWASGLGFLYFGNVPTQSTVIGAAVIFVASVWIARHEARRPAAPGAAPIPESTGASAGTGPVRR